MKTLLITLVASLLSLSAYADYNLAANGKKVNCYADDNQSWELNPGRTSIKYTVEGESRGAKKIKKTNTDGDTSVSYQTEEGTLTLSDQGDTWQFKGDTQAQLIRCR